MKIQFTFTLFIALLFASPILTNAQVIEDDWDYENEYDQETESFNTNSNLPGLKVSPNPVSNNHIKVWFNKLQSQSLIAVYDLAGRVYHRAFVGSNRNRAGVHYVNTSRMTPGVYVVMLRSGDYKVSRKVMVR